MRARSPREGVRFGRSLHYRQRAVNHLACPRCAPYFRACRESRLTSPMRISPASGAGLGGGEAGSAAGTPSAISCRRAARQGPPQPFGPRTLGGAGDPPVLLIICCGRAYVADGRRHPASRPLEGELSLWYRVRREVGIEDVLLRHPQHTRDSHAVMNGVSVSVVSRMLGISNVRMTLRYAHLGDQEIEEATAKVGQASADTTWSAMAITRYARAKCTCCRHQRGYRESTRSRLQPECSRRPRQRSPTC